MLPLISFSAISCLRWSALYPSLGFSYTEGWADVELMQARSTPHQPYEWTTPGQNKHKPLIHMAFFLISGARPAQVCFSGDCLLARLAYVHTGPLPEAWARVESKKLASAKRK